LGECHGKSTCHIWTRHLEVQSTHALDRMVWTNSKKPEFGRNDSLWMAADCKADAGVKCSFYESGFYNTWRINENIYSGDFSLFLLPHWSTLVLIHQWNGKYFATTIGTTSRNGALQVDLRAIGTASYFQGQDLKKYLILEKLKNGETFSQEKI